MLDGQPRLVSVQPEDLLNDLGVKPGDDRDGVKFFKNACPSKGTMDIFIEPVLPKPVLAVFGASPVALALSSSASSLAIMLWLAAQDFVWSVPIADEILAGFEIRRWHMPVSAMW